MELTKSFLQLMNYCYDIMHGIHVIHNMNFQGIHGIQPRHSNVQHANISPTPPPPPPPPSSQS